MNLNIKPVRYSARLPATPCTEDMRRSILDLAHSQGVTVAELQRYIFQVFLSENVSIANSLVGQANKEQEAVL